MLHMQVLQMTTDASNLTSLASYTMCRSASNKEKLKTETE